MASLALLVSIMLFSVLFAGPLALIFSKLNLKVLSFATALFAVIFGSWWLFVTPFPISIAGLLSLVLGLKVLYKLNSKNDKL